MIIFLINAMFNQPFFEFRATEEDMFVMIEEMSYVIQDGKATILIVLLLFVFLRVKVKFSS